MNKIKIMSILGLAIGKIENSNSNNNFCFTYGTSYMGIEAFDNYIALNYKWIKYKFYYNDKNWEFNFLCKMQELIEE